MKFSAPLFIALAAAATGCGKKPPSPGAAEPISVDMRLIDGSGPAQSIGAIQFNNADGGLTIKPNLKGLPPGSHGFHVHLNPDCGPKEKDGKTTPGEAAGDHYDPAGTGKHAGPEGAGHTGDLPRLVVAADGTATETMTVARLQVAELKKRSIMIHAEDDDFAGAPGGARIACGVVP